MVHRHSIAYTTVALCFALGTAASAQGYGGSGAGTGATGSSSTGTSSTSGTASGQSNAGGNWTMQNVTTSDPFGSIDVMRAGTTVESVRTWAQGRTVAERNELMGRCGVIQRNTSTNYSEQARQFCQNFAATSESGSGRPSGQ